MSVNKFGKHRSVDGRYLNVPYKYLTRVDGAYTKPKSSRLMTLQEFKDEKKRICEEWQDECPSDEELKTEFKELHKKHKNPNDEDEWLTEHVLAFNKPIELIKNKNKELCIVDFFGKKKALVGWRNSNKCSISLPKICPIVYKGKKGYIIYKGKKIEFTNQSGWVF